MPRGITSGPDGAVWFTEHGSNKIGRIASDAPYTLTRLAVPTAGALPASIVTGPDSNLWFTEMGGNKIGRVTPHAPHTITEFAVPTADGVPVGITVGPDGNLWFTEFGGNKIGRITPDAPHTITEFAIPSAGGEPVGIAVGPDGNLWFTEFGGNKIGRITPHAPYTITEFALPTGGSQPHDITAGPDGNLWFTEHGADKIGRITPTARPTITEFPLPEDSAPTDIEAGLDGHLWFTEYNSNRIGRITAHAPQGITEFAVPSPRSGPHDVDLGPDGALWFTEFGADKIGRISPDAPHTISEVPLTGTSVEAAAPEWLRYTRPASFEAVTTDMGVPMRDGVELRCSLVRPGLAGAPAPGRFSGLVMDFAAYKASQATAFEQHARWFAERGYAVLLCPPRGTGGSPGMWEPFTNQELEDNYDLIEWLASQPWSSGRVGQTGMSYGGITSFRAATARPPHLVAIAPISAYASAYLDWQYLGGIRAKVLRWWPVVVWALGALGQDPAAQAMLARQAVAWEQEAAAHPIYDAYWRERDVDVAALDASDIPVLGIGGWHDMFRRGMVANYEAARDQSWLLMFPLTHRELSPNPPGYPAELDAARLAWFDHWLLGLHDAPLPASRVTSWELPRGTGGWREFDHWPAPAPRRYHLDAGGSLALRPGAEARITYQVNPADTSCICADRGYAPPTSDDPLNDQRMADRARPHFNSEPLAHPLLIAGAPVARLRVALSASDGNLVVHLADVAPNGASSVITSGWLRASHRLSHESPEVLSPGKPYDIEVPLWPIHWRLPAGHRLRVSLTSGDLASIEPNAPPGTVTVVLGVGGSSVDLP